MALHKKQTNYFIINRTLLNSDRWLSEKFTRAQAWIDLIGLAQHTKGFFRVRGIKVDLNRGQLGYSQLSLSKRWSWSRNKVKRYLKELENDGDLIQQNNTVTTVITVKNYNLWQGNDTTNDTTEGQQKDNKRTTYNNDKKKKNDNIYMTDIDFNLFWDTYPRKIGKTNAKNKFLKIKRELLEKIMSSLKNYILTEQWSKDTQFIPHPTTWLNGERWNDEIVTNSLNSKLYG